MIARTLDLEHLTLEYGQHDPESGEMCVMEAVAYVAGEPGDPTLCPHCGGNRSTYIVL